MAMTAPDPMTLHTNQMTLASWTGALIGGVLATATMVISAACHRTSAPEPIPDASSTPAVGLLTPGSAPSSASTSPVPLLAEREVCALLVPVAGDTADVVLALAASPDGSTVNRYQLDKAIDRLKELEDVTPDTLRPDVQTQLRTMRQVSFTISTRTPMHLDLADFRATGPHIAAQCAPYATR